MKVVVLCGGNSAEHEISLASGREVVQYLDKRKYQVLPIVISRDGKRWFNVTPKKFLEGIHKESKGLAPLEALRKLQKEKINLCFIVLHGPFGEDGRVQALLELLGIPYTGSGVLSSALGMNKFHSREIFVQNGLNVPQTVMLEGKDKLERIWERLQPPVVVKPSRQGSSVGVSIVRQKNKLPEAIKIALRFGLTVLVEEYIAGREVTCSILGNDRGEALPLVEILPKNDFFDYEAKYNPKKCQEIVPARIPPHLTKKAQQAALAAYKLLGCRGFARVDMIIRESQVYILEVNTIPGLTSVSLLPKAAQATGISFPKLLDKIIEFALEKTPPAGD